MQIGIIGLGRMGANIGRRLIKSGHQVVGYDASAGAVKALEGAVGAASLEELVSKLAPPRVVWLMLPAGRITEETVATLGKLLSRDDCLIDGGNTFFKDDIRRCLGL
jgi:6-phosphogluconate dehydrogenase